MAKQVFVIEYEFTSTKADGDAYTRRLEIRADSAQAAMNVAHIEGASRFGARFTDNCFDWQIVESRPK